MGKKMENECIDELKAFVRGGLPGLETLQRVYPSIIKHFQIKDKQTYYRVMHKAGIPAKTHLEWKLPSFLCASRNPRKQAPMIGCR